MGHDIEFKRGESFGEWLHKEIVEAVTLEDAPWAIERIRRVETRLQAGRPRSDRLTVEIPWWEEPTAFTGPGQYINDNIERGAQSMTPNPAASGSRAIISLFHAQRFGRAGPEPLGHETLYGI
jgi:hypothetical protein